MALPFQDVIYKLIDDSVEDIKLEEIIHGIITAFQQTPQGSPEIRENFPNLQIHSAGAWTYQFDSARILYLTYDIEFVALSAPFGNIYNIYVSKKDNEIAPFTFLKTVSFQFHNYDAFLTIVRTIERAITLHAEQEVGPRYL